MLRSPALTSELAKQLIASIRNPAALGQVALSLYTQFLRPEDLDSYSANPEAFAADAQKFLIAMASVYRQDEKLAGLINIATRQAGELQKANAALVEVQVDSLLYQYVAKRALNFITEVLSGLEKGGYDTTPLKESWKVVNDDINNYYEQLKLWKKQRLQTEAAITIGDKNE